MSPAQSLSSTHQVLRAFIYLTYCSSACGILLSSCLSQGFDWGDGHLTTRYNPLLLEDVLRQELRYSFASHSFVLLASRTTPKQSNPHARAIKRERVHYNSAVFPNQEWLI
eukprot:5734317-Amphidinium_carterae.1